MQPHRRNRIYVHPTNEQKEDEEEGAASSICSRQNRFTGRGGQTIKLAMLMAEWILVVDGQWISAALIKHSVAIWADSDCCADFRWDPGKGRDPIIVAKDPGGIREVFGSRILGADPFLPGLPPTKNLHYHAVLSRLNFRAHSE